MFKDLPFGPLINSSDTNLNNYFGFVYGEIIPPSEERLFLFLFLIVAYIEFRYPNTGWLSCSPKEEHLFLD